MAKRYILRHAFTVRKQHPELENETIEHINSGHHYLGRNNIGKAVEHYGKALKSAWKKEDKENETVAYIGLGNVHIQNKQIDMAIIYYKKALDIATRREDRENETSAYLGLGDAYEKVNRTNKAFENYREALRIAKRRQDKQSEKIAMSGLERYCEKCMLGEEVYAQKNLNTYVVLGESCEEEPQILMVTEHYENTREQRDEGEERKARNAMQQWSTEEGRQNSNCNEGCPSKSVDCKL